MNNNPEEEKIVSAYEKAAQDGIDPRCIPQVLDNPVPTHDEITYPNYTSEEQSNWRFLYNRQMKFLPGRACEEYIEGATKLNLSEEKIPYLKDLSHIFFNSTGWKVARVPGLIHEQNFFELLRSARVPPEDRATGCRCA